MSEQQFIDRRPDICAALRELLNEVLHTGKVSRDVLERFRAQVPITAKAFGGKPDAQRYMDEIQDMAEELSSNPSPARSSELEKAFTDHNPQMRKFLLGFCNPNAPQKEESTS